MEPDPRMLRVLSARNPAARLHQSDSCHLPVLDASLDAVLVADAWHWFDAVSTIDEVRRVLKPAGWLGLVWNVVAEPVEDWEVAIDGEADQYDRMSKGNVAGLTRQLSGVAAGELDFAQIEWDWELTPDHRASLLATTSMAIAMTPADRAVAIERARAELRQVCVAHGRQSMPVRYIASCIRWTPDNPGAGRTG